MEPKPKERIVFDEDSYYGDEGEGDGDKRPHGT